jgi:hypothetical protein
MKLNPTYSSGDINFIHDEAQIFVESILNNLDDNITPILGDDGSYHYVYLVVNKTNGFFYIGKRTVLERVNGKYRSMYTLEYVLRNYLGGGIEIQKAVKEYGRKSFLRFVLKFCTSSEDAFNLEKNLVNNISIERYSRQLGCMYNLVTGGRGGIGKGRNNNAGNKKLKIKKDHHTIFIYSCDLLKYMLDGYRLTCSSTIIIKKQNDKIISKALNFNRINTRLRKVDQSVLLNYLQDGWIVGRLTSSKIYDLL